MFHVNPLYVLLVNPFVSDALSSHGAARSVTAEKFTDLVVPESLSLILSLSLSLLPSSVLAVSDHWC